MFFSNFQYPPSMFGEEDDIECDYDDDYLMLTAPSNLMAEHPRVQETGRVSTILFPQVFPRHIIPRVVVTVISLC